MSERTGSETRKKILDAGKKLFSEEGYGAASMRAIAGEAGISAACVYLYFKGKEDLYLTLMNEWMDELTQETRSALEGLHSPADALAAFIRGSLAFASRQREIILLHGKTAGFVFVSERKQEFFRTRRAIIARIVANGIETGDFRPCDSVEVAKIVFNMIRGYVFSMMVEDDALYSPDACVELILNGLARRSET
jgi:AcrR family transcriptional regulator